MTNTPPMLIFSTMHHLYLLSKVYDPSRSNIAQLRRIVYDNRCKSTECSASQKWTSNRPDGTLYHAQENIKIKNTKNTRKG